MLMLRAEWLQQVLLGSQFCFAFPLGWIIFSLFHVGSQRLLSPLSQHVLLPHPPTFFSGHLNYMLGQVQGYWHVTYNNQCPSKGGRIYGEGGPLNLSPLLVSVNLPVRMFKGQSTSQLPQHMPLNSYFQRVPTASDYNPRWMQDLSLCAVQGLGQCTGGLPQPCTSSKELQHQAHASDLWLKGSSPQTGMATGDMEELGRLTGRHGLTLPDLLCSGNSSPSPGRQCCLCPLHCTL